MTTVVLGTKCRCDDSDDMFHVLHEPEYLPAMGGALPKRCDRN
jgi:hypothetical protein